ncbi:right-handed parallel beta-helix repeat-containing protein [Micromonospora sp. M12]
MWHSQLYTLTEPQNVVGGINHPHEGNFGFDIDKNTQISDIAIFGSGRIRGGDGNGEGGVGLNGRFGTGTKISNVWIEHANVGVWVGRDYDNIPDLWGRPTGWSSPACGSATRTPTASTSATARVTRGCSTRPSGPPVTTRWPSGPTRTSGPQRGHRPRQPLRQQHHPAALAGQRHRHLRRLRQLDREQPDLRHRELPGHHAGDRPRPAAVLRHDVDRQQRALPHRRRLLERGPGVRCHHDLPATRDIVGVTIRDTDIIDSTFDGIQFKNGGGNIPNLAITNVRIDKSNNGAGILAMSGARGNAILTNVTITNSADGSIVIQPGSQFVITP